MKKQIKLERQAATEESAQQQAQQGGSQEFASVEQMLRHDAEHTVVPPRVAYRLQQSLGPGNARGVPWWRRMLGK
jgi:hypothetical protein